MSIYHDLIDYLKESPLIIQILWIMTGLFIIIIIFLIFRLRSLRKGLRSKGRTIALYEKKYEAYLLNYLYSESDEEISASQKVIISQLKKSTKDPFIRKILLSLLVKLKQEVSGEISDSVQRLYFQIGLVDYAVARLYHKKWYVIAKGIRELNQFQVKAAHDDVMMHINHPRREVRKEMQLYMVNLFHAEGLNFLAQLEMQLSEWDQIQLLRVLQQLENQENLNIKSWLKSNNHSIVCFALKLAEIYSDIESIDEILKLLHHIEQRIRVESIRVLSVLNAVQAKYILKADIESRSTEEQIAFFAMMENLFDVSDESFISAYVDHPVFEIKVSALKILKVINRAKFDALKTESTDPHFLRIITFIEKN
ncbi:hypothetical protein FLAN108750_08850 [Flavobacterium antarcticum]|uniref:hypothetical protein n=1 Tax=Flavobacterium antarcticum TaxID=271155 RepID=UPI0003B53B87|nr:hypothetical protein [Flavobacterium antarcticum]